MKGITIHKPFASHSTPDYQVRSQGRLVKQHISKHFPLPTWVRRRQRFCRAPVDSKAPLPHIACAGKASISSISAAAEARDDDVRPFHALSSVIAVLTPKDVCFEPQDVVLQVLPDSFSQALEHAALATHSAISDGGSRCLVCFATKSWVAFSLRGHTNGV